MPPSPAVVISSSPDESGRAGGDAAGLVPRDDLDWVVHEHEVAMSKSWPPPHGVRLGLKCGCAAELTGPPHGGLLFQALDLAHGVAQPATIVSNVAACYKELADLMPVVRAGVHEAGSFGVVSTLAPATLASCWSFEAIAAVGVKTERRCGCKDISAKACCTDARLLMFIYMHYVGCEIPMLDGTSLAASYLMPCLTLACHDSQLENRISVIYAQNSIRVQGASKTLQISFRLRLWSQPNPPCLHPK